jgi:cytochrome c-type biogenesis protein CcmH/NrfG/O-antigen ligase
LKSTQTVVWLLLVTLAPLWVNLWGQQPFELPKVMLVRSLIWVLASLFIIEQFLKRRSFSRQSWANPLFGPLGLLALTILVTTATAIDWRLSLWGSYERGQGAITILSYLLLFALAAVQFRRVARARLLITAMAGTAVPLVLISLAQKGGWNPFNLVSDARSPVFATLGRANFLGAYLVILLPLTLALLLTSRKRGVRLLWAAVLLGDILVIGLTQARGAILAAFISLLLFALIWWDSHLKRKWRMLGWSGLIMLGSSGPLAVLWLGRGEAGSSAARLAIWQGVVELIRERPFLGYGLDSMSLVFPRVYLPELVYYQGREFFVDRAHNLFLDWALAAGIPGLLAFLFLLGSFLFLSGRSLQKGHTSRKRALLAAIVAAVVANSANNLVSFDVTPSAAATWLLMGVGTALAMAPINLTPQREVEKDPTQHWMLSAFLVLFFGTAIWHLNARPLIADSFARSAVGQAQNGEWIEANANAAQAVALWPFEATYYVQLGQTYQQLASDEAAQASTHLRQAKTALQKARQLRPDDWRLWLSTAQFYTAVDKRSQADDAYRQALSLAPNQATIYIAWAQTFNDPQKAAPLLREAVRLDGSNGQAYIYLGAAELALNRLDIALADYHEAVRLAPDSSHAYAGLANVYWQMDQPQEALLAAQQALVCNPQNAGALTVIQALQNRR